MTRRQLLKQAKHVLGPDADVAVFQAKTLLWKAEAWSQAHGVDTSAATRRDALANLNTMLATLDVGGWTWRST